MILGTWRLDSELKVIACDQISTAIENLNRELERRGYSPDAREDDFEPVVWDSAKAQFVEPATQTGR